MPAPSGIFYIQVGAYAKPENARSALRKLRGAGLENAFTLGPDAHQPLQRVRIGPIASVQQFDRLIERLQCARISERKARTGLKSAATLCALARRETSGA